MIFCQSPDDSLRSFRPALLDRSSLVFNPKTRPSAIPTKSIRARCEETEALFYLPIRLYRPCHRACARGQIALPCTHRRLKTQSA
jgi:hypothetical protein